MKMGRECGEEESEREKEQESKRNIHCCLLLWLCFDKVFTYRKSESKYHCVSFLYYPRISRGTERKKEKEKKKSSFFF